MDFVDLFAGKQHISARVVDNFLNREAARVFEETEEIINIQLNRLNEILAIGEPTLGARYLQSSGK